MPLPDFPKNAFSKDDSRPDATFYAEPRFVTHIDDAAIAAVTETYRAFLPSGLAILDLMSSWVSHLPPEVDYAEVVGHGMNARELAANPRFSRWFVQDLNADPALPLASASFGAAAICVSIQYLEEPVAVLSDVKRVLQPGAPLVIAFSNRCFPTKAVSIWKALGGRAHLRLVSLYLEEAGLNSIEGIEAIAPGGPSDPLWVAVGRA